MEVKVGIGVIIYKNDKVLLGKRKGSHGNGTWCFTGGHLEFGETFEDCAKRETLEEAGINIKNIQYIYTTNDIHRLENKHYVTIFMKCDYDSGNVKLLEEDKFEKWEWFDKQNLPENLFLPIKNLLNKKRNLL